MNKLEKFRFLSIFISQGTRQISKQQNENHKSQKSKNLSCSTSSSNYASSSYVSFDYVMNALARLESLEHLAFGS
jgi:hypothetical protein